MRRLLVAAPAALLLLTGCAAGDPVAERRNAVAAITDAANDGDVDGVRDEVSDLLSVLREQVANGDVDRAEADRLRAIAERIRDGAAVLEPVESPSPEPSEEPSEEPPPSPSPSPEVSEEPVPTPEPEVPEPEVTQEPPVVEPPPDPSPTPAQVSQEGTAPPPAVVEPSPQPTA